MSYKHFSNKVCEYYPCHKLENQNCLFCFCLLYFFKDCGGDYIIMNSIKDCSNCKKNHDENSYNFVIEKLHAVFKKMNKDFKYMEIGSNMLENFLKNIEKADNEFLKRASERNDNLLMPFRAMGRLHEIAEQLCSIYRTLKPEVKKAAVFVMAGDHGVVEEGVSPFPQEVTGLMFNCFLNDLATVSVLSKKENVDVILADIGSKFDSSKVKNYKNEFVVKKIVSGTKNFTKEPAMTREEAIKTIEAGIEITLKYIKEKNLDIVITGEMGIGNTTPSAAIGSVITGLPVEEMTGKGAGLTEEGVLNKVDVIKKGIELHKPDRHDPIDVLSKVGGAEIGAIAGIIIAAAYSKIPVVIDGFISTAGALIAYELNKDVKEYMIAGHCSEESGHIKMLKYLNLKPLLNLNLRLGEGTGGVLALPIIKQAANLISNVATFAEAGIPK